MRALYGYDVAADLQSECRYDQVAIALGAGGETVKDPKDLYAAINRGLNYDGPYLLNVILDPEVTYPRTSNLA
jgi:acetolactate synthase-1/2/3 large subunit